MVSLAGLHAQELRPHKNLETTNIRHIYDLQAPVALEYRLASGEDEFTVFLQLTERLRPTGDMRISFELRPDFESDNILSTGLIDSTYLIASEEQQTYYRFTIPENADAGYLFVFVNKVFNGQEAEFRFDIPLGTEQNFPVADLIPMRADADIPIFNNYITRGTSFRLVSIYHEQPQAFVYQYSHNFEPNPPPMASDDADVQPNLQIDSIFPVELNQNISLQDEGLYFAQLDTTSLAGMAFRVESKYYPRFVEAKELIDPLRYISTSDEMNLLQEAEEEKLALDRYFIKVTRSRERAKEMIRDYYRQVTAANRLFTTYKEGWKTGQGMVYLLYGPPNRVYRNSNGETWEYTGGSNLVDLSFNFVKVRNIFTDKHYNLLRDEDYRRFWFRNIDLWRKGIKQI